MSKQVGRQSWLGTKLRKQNAAVLSVKLPIPPSCCCTRTSRTLRTRENPLEWTPLDLRPRITSPAYGSQKKVEARQQMERAAVECTPARLPAA